MAERTPGSTRARELDRVHRAADGCRDCPLYEHATQMVFGEGPAPAELMLLGEQPGDKEDRAGHPFVGPAGALLDEVLVDAGIDRSVVYLTNTVKHFKWDHTRGGKVRIHKSPSRSEVVACSQWWQRELAVVTPKVLVCLGAIATKAVLGPKALVTELRGQVVEQLAVAVVPTYHPAAVLRAAERKDQMRDDLVRDLHVAAGLLDD